MLEKKKYDICAIGNAIVDVVIEVEDSFLVENNIVKGQMTLIEDRECELLLKNFEETNKMLVCGGSAANSLNLASRLGADCFFQGMLSCDSTGDHFIQDLKKHNIETQVNVFQRVNSNTGRCIVMITPDGQRTMSTSLGIAKNMCPDALCESAIINSSYLYIEGYMVSSFYCFKAIEKAIKIARENNTKTALTFSDPSMPTYFKEQLEQILEEKIDVLFCNKKELLIYTQKDNFEDAIIELKKYTKLLVITLGSKGAIAISDEERYSVEGAKVTCIDTNGAGDAFAGSFMYGMIKQKDIHDIMIVANIHASTMVTQWGARLESL